MTGQADVSEMVKFVLARLGDDERIALAAAHGDGSEWHSREGYVYSSPFDPPSGPEDVEHGIAVIYDEGCLTPQEAEHIARHDPKRVLLGVAAVRQILAGTYSQDLVRTLASVYSDHPDYRKEWNR